MTDLNDIIRDEGSTLFKVLDDLNIVEIPVDIKDVDTQLRSLATEVQILRSGTEGALNALNGRVTNVEIMNDQLESIFGVLQNEFSEIVTTVDGLKFEDQRIYDRIDEIDIRIDGLSGEISNLQPQIVDLDNQINSVNTKVDSFETSITNLRNDVNTLIIDNNILTSRITALQRETSVKPGGTYILVNQTSTNHWVRELKIDVSSHLIGLGTEFSGTLGGTSYSSMYFSDPADLFGKTTSIQGSIPLGRTWFYYGTATSHTRSDVYITVKQ